MVVDVDLVTGHSKDEVHLFIQAIADRIVNMSNNAPEVTETTTVKKILCVLSEWGYWGEELIGPWKRLTTLGIRSILRRRMASVLSLSRPAWTPPSSILLSVRGVVSAEMAEKVKAIDGLSNPRLDNPISLAAWLPDYPYHCDPLYLRGTEKYYSDLALVQGGIADYAALLLVGGSGPISRYGE